MLAGKLSRRGLTEIHDKGGNLQALQAKQKVSGDALDRRKRRLSRNEPSGATDVKPWRIV